MLSYRHAFHAGNFADVLKHLVLANSLHYLRRKDAPLLYIDTHAGAGRYSLRDPKALQTGEAERGILSLDLSDLEAQASEAGREALRHYHEALMPFLASGHYPGSPALAAGLLRPQDRLRLFEHHPTDQALLRTLFAQDRRVRCDPGDGFASAAALLPPPGKRALVLIDPSYELKEDYRKVVDYVVTAAKRLPGVTLLLWYPVLQEGQHERLARELQRLPLRDLWRFELGLNADPGVGGMRASGLFVLNPPWTLPEQLRGCLPLLARALGGEEGTWSVDCLIPE